MLEKKYKMENLIWHSVFVPIMDTVTGISNHVVVAVLLPDNTDKTRFIEKNKFDHQKVLHELPGICTEFAIITNVTNAIAVPILLAWVRHLWHSEYSLVTTVNIICTWGQLSKKLNTPSASASWLHAFPIPSPSVSAWSKFLFIGQLSHALPTWFRKAQALF